MVTEDGITKKYDVGDVSINPITSTSGIFIENFFTAFVTSIQKAKLNGRTCYIINDGSVKKYIDYETGIALKAVDTQFNITIDYTYEAGNVKDSDVQNPYMSNTVN